MTAEPQPLRARASRRRGVKGRRTWLRVIGALALAVVLVAGWVAFRGYQAARALQQVRASVVRLEHGLLDGTASTGDLTSAQGAAARAAAATSDPVWRAVEVVPWAGTQLRAVDVLSASLDEVTHDVLPPVMDLVGRVRDGSIRTSDGSFDVAVLHAAAPAMVAADGAAGRAEARVASLHAEGLVGALAGPVRTAQDQFVTLASTVHSARTVVELAPAMLGASGPRTYLVVALNNAELRSAGGIVGSVIAIHFDDGKATLGAQLSTADLRALAQPVLPLTAEETALGGDRIGRWVQDATMTTDFPRTGELVAARWIASEGGTVDGVVSLDAPAVATLLRATGPVATSTGEQLTSATFVDAVLRDPYLADRDPLAVDHLFADVAGSVFHSIAQGGGDPKALLSAVRSVVADQRLRLWSAHPDEQAALVQTTAGSAFLTGSFGRDVGVFLNDGTAGKLDYYLATSLQVVSQSCTASRATATLRLTLTYRPPAGVASSSRSLRGPGQPGLAPGDVSTAISVYAGVGDQVGPITRDGAAVGGRLVTVAGRGTVTFTSVLAPGQTAVYELQVPVPTTGSTIWTTPTLSQAGSLTRVCGAVTSTGAPTG